MKSRLRQVPWIVVMLVALATQGLAKTGGQVKLSGQISDFTADLDGLGSWHVTGPWSLQVKRAGGKARFSASLAMVRSDNPVRQSHTHHVRLTDAVVTPIPGGFSITGPARITGNGSLAGFSGSTIVVEVVGGDTVPYASIRVTFQDGAVLHFGGEPLDGVVKSSR